MAAEGEEFVYCLNCSHRFQNSLRLCPACGARNLLYVKHKDRVTAGLLALSALLSRTSVCVGLPFSLLFLAIGIDGLVG